MSGANGRRLDKNVDRKGTRAVAQVYLEFLYSPEGQEIAAANDYRPRDAKVAAKHASTFNLKVSLFTIDEVFGGWTKAQATHFNDGGMFDKIFTRKSASPRISVFCISKRKTLRW